MSDDIDVLINEGLGLISAKKALSSFQLAETASRLLVICAKLSQARYDIEQEVSKYLSVERATYSQVMSGLDKSTKVTEKKALVEADNTYVKSRESLEGAQSTITYLKTMYEIMNNAHILFRQLMREP